MAGSSGRGGGGGVLVPPRIIDDPTNVTVLRNEPATLRCAFDGIPPPEVTWYREGEALEPRGHRLVLPDGALFFLRVTQSRGGGRSGNGGGDAGTYWCVARNAAGQARSRNATLTVACKSSLLFSVISFYECLICRWHGPIFPPPLTILSPLALTHSYFACLYLRFKSDSTPPHLLCKHQRSPLNELHHSASSFTMPWLSIWNYAAHAGHFFVGTAQLAFIPRHNLLGAIT